MFTAGSSHGTGQENSRELEVLPGFDDASQPHLNVALAANALRAGAPDLMAESRERRSGGAGGSVAPLETVVLKAQARRDADALNASDGVGRVRRGGRMGRQRSGGRHGTGTGLSAAGQAVIGVASKDAAPGVVGSLGSLGGLVDAMRSGQRLLRHAARRAQRKREAAMEQVLLAEREDGIADSPRGMQFNVGSTDEQREKLADVRAGAAKDAAIVLAASIRGNGST